MEQRTNVPTQAALLAVVGVAAAAICGHNAGFAITAIVAVGSILWFGLALPYRVRVREPRDIDRQELDRRAFRSALLGFLSVLIAGVVVWQEPSFHGLWLSSGAAALAVALAVLIFTAILTSSMVDWYLILPWAFGLFRGCSPIWAIGDDAPDLNEDRRRRFAQVWVFHRGLCEFVVFTSVALLLALGLVALGNALSSDKTIPTAFESLGGAGVAVGIFGYLGPRLRYGMNFMLAGPLGLGMWVKSTDVVERQFAGLVIDVSIYPGVKLVNESGERFFLPLGITHNVSEVESPPAAVTPAWREAMIKHHLGRDALRPNRESLRNRLRKRFKSFLASSGGSAEEQPEPR